MLAARDGVEAASRLPTLLDGPLVNHPPSEGQRLHNKHRVSSE